MTDYLEVLRELESRERELKEELAEIQAAKPALVRLAGKHAFGAQMVPITSVPQTVLTATATPIGRFTGMGTKEAVIALLSGIAGPLSVAEITSALLGGGIKTNSQDFASVVKSTMAQLKGEGKAERKEDGWIAVRNPSGFVSSENPQPSWQ